MKALIKTTAAGREVVDIVADQKQAIKLLQDTGYPDLAIVDYDDLSPTEKVFADSIDADET